MTALDPDAPENQVSARAGDQDADMILSGWRGDEASIFSGWCMVGDFWLAPFLNRPKSITAVTVKNRQSTTPRVRMRKNELSLLLFGSLPRTRTQNPAKDSNLAADHSRLRA